MQVIKICMAYFNGMKQKVFKYFIWSVTVLWMVMIFLLSAQPAEESSNTSSTFTQEILEIFPSFNNLPPEQKVDKVEKLQFSVRKCAHFTLYACLGVLMYGSFSCIDTIKKKRILAFCGTALYAGSDEFHQFFVEGRSCEIRDVCIDASGALFGIALVSLIVFCITKVSQKRKNHSEK